MNFDLRKAVIANLDDSNYDEIRETIIDAIESGEEKNTSWIRSYVWNLMEWKQWFRKRNNGFTYYSMFKTKGSLI